MESRANFNTSGGFPVKRFKFGAGMTERSIDGNAYDPQSNNMVGMDGNPSSEGVNDDVDLKLCAMPTKRVGKWVNEYPLYSILFAATGPFVNELKMLNGRGRRNIVRPMDCVEMFTPEQLNYLIQTDFNEKVRLVLAGKLTSVPTPAEYLAMYRLLGINNREPAQDTTGGIEPRVINFRPTTSRFIQDYWGPRTRGNAKQTLMLAMKMVQIRDDQTVYSLNDSDTDIRYVSNRITAADGDGLVKFVPRLVPVCSGFHRSLEEADRMTTYEVPVYYPIDGKVEWRTLRTKTPFVYIGKTIRNQNAGTTAEDAPTMDLCSMSQRNNMHVLDATISIEENLRVGDLAAI